MKIMHLVQKPQLRGAEMFASQLATHCTEKGVSSFMTFLYKGSSQLPFDGKKYFLDRPQGRKFIDWKGWKDLANIIKLENPSLIQANAGATLKYAIFSKLFFRWKQPVVFRNASTISLYIKNPLMKFINGFFFRRTDKIISVSQKSADDFKQLFPKESHKVVVIPIGIETGSTSLEIADEHLNGKLSGTPSILHVGGFSFEKNHKGLLSIFSELLALKKDAELHLVGDGPLRQEVQNLVEVMGLSNKVHFYGFRKNAMDFMRQADLLVLPSIIEGLPGVILEAFYCKLPVVAYHVGGIGEVLIHEKTGRLIAPGDESDFVQKMIDSLTKDANNEKIKEKAFELVNSSYLNDKIAVNFISTYSDMC